MFARIALLVAALIGSAAAQDCGTGPVSIAGSSTVEPITKAWATKYMEKCPASVVTVAGGGSGAGARRVCGGTGGQVDIGNMSREFNSREVTNTTGGVLGTDYTCVAAPNNKVKQIDVALDGISVVLVAGGLGSQCIRKITANGGPGLTRDQLRFAYSNFSLAQLTASTFPYKGLGVNADTVNATSRNWAALDPGCPNSNIVISGPDGNSGTNVFFVEAILGGSGEGFATNRAGGYFNSISDEVLVEFVETSSEQTYGDAMCYFGFSFFLAEGALLYGAPIENKDGVKVAPTKANIENLSYNPLGRKIFMQVWQNDASLANTKPYVAFGLSNTGTQIVESVGYVGLPKADRTANLAKLGLPEPNDTPPPPPPTTVPTFTDDYVAPAKLCGLLGFRLFCLTGCGLLGRLIGLCNE